MAVINLETIADYFESLLTGGATPIINPSLFVAEGQLFDSENMPLYVAEIKGIDDETPTLARNHAGLYTITYNVYSTVSQPDIVTDAENLRSSIIGVFNEACFPEIAGVNFTYFLPTRRTATINNDGDYRIAPVDITFKVAGLEY